jgi:hypothetical protein
MMKKNIIESGEELDGYLLDHLMDTIPIGNKITLLHYVFADKMTDPNLEMKERIKKWFISQQIETTGDFPLTALVFYEVTSKKGEGEKVYIRENANKDAAEGDPDNHIWTPGQHEDIKDVRQYLRETVPLLHEDVSRWFGFNGDDKKNENIIFKLKDVLDKRSKGHHCIAMKKNEKVDLLRILLPDEVVESLKYVSPLKKSKENEVSYHIMQEMCIFAEFTLRHYDFIKKDGKRWFFTYNEYHRFRDILRV